MAAYAETHTGNLLAENGKFHLEALSPFSFEKYDREISMGLLHEICFLIYKIFLCLEKYSIITCGCGRNYPLIHLKLRKYI